MNDGGNSSVSTCSVPPPPQYNVAIRFGASGRTYLDGQLPLPDVCTDFERSRIIELFGRMMNFARGYADLSLTVVERPTAIIRGEEEQRLYDALDTLLMHLGEVPRQINQALRVEEMVDAVKEFVNTRKKAPGKKAPAAKKVTPKKKATKKAAKPAAKKKTKR